MKERLDVLLVKQGFAASREKAKAIIMSGIVYVNDQKEDKSGTMFEEAKANATDQGMLVFSWLAQFKRLL